VPLARNELGIESPAARVDGSPVWRPHGRRLTSLGDPLDQLGQLRSLRSEIEGLDLTQDQGSASRVERPDSSRVAGAPQGSNAEVLPTVQNRAITR